MSEVSLQEDLLQSQSVTVSEDLDRQKGHTKKPDRNRPAMQIYRPPGLRSGGSEATASGGSSPQVGSPSKPTPAAGHKQPDTNGHGIRKDREENNNVRHERDSVGSTGSRASSRGSGSQNTSDKVEERPQRLNRTESSLSSESAISQRSQGSLGGSLGSGGGKEIPPERKIKQPSPPKKEIKPPKRVLTDRELEDVSVGLRALQIGTNAAELEQWINGSYLSEALAEVVGAALCQHAIEGGGGRVVAKLCGTLKYSPAAAGLTKGLLNSVSQYFECRDRLRADHFRIWIGFLTFATDLYSNLGGGAEGELVSVVFQVFDFLLKAPVLENLKIEELESLISALLTVGYDLERECPDQLSLLKDLIRDALIEVTEPWARKMILLLLELGASGWKLPAEANEYYFQQSNN